LRTRPCEIGAVWKARARRWSLLKKSLIDSSGTRLFQQAPMALRLNEHSRRPIVDRRRWVMR